jgi:AraC-like DNA-binding protein
MATLGYVFGKTDLLLQCVGNKRLNRYYTIVYVREGAGLYSAGASLRTLNAGDILILPPWIEFSFRSEDLGDEYNVNLDAVVLRFDDMWLDKLLKAFPSLAPVVLKIKEMRKHFSVRGLKWMKLTSVFAELETGDILEHPSKILTILRLISTEDDMEVIRDYNDADPLTVAARIEKIDKYLGCNFRDKVTLQELADYVGMSRTYFSIFFKTHYKEGFSDYLNRKRLECAASLLLKTDLPISAISEDCGFTTVQYFTRTFRRLMGISPGAYRRR